MDSTSNTCTQLPPMAAATAMMDQVTIGIVSQPLNAIMRGDERFQGQHSYIADSYVKFLESEGARIIPLVMDEERKVTDEKLTQVNGVLFPGGAGDYHGYARYIYNKVVEANDAGDYLPMWGICKGYEYMAVFASSSGDPLSDLVS